MKFMLGADPELFLQDAAGAFVSAIGKIGGSKDAPLPLPIGPGFAVQEDNVAVEYNIPPSVSESEFDANVDMAMQFLSAHVNNMGLRFAKDSAVSFPDNQLDHPLSRVFGCDPDFNAWKDGKQNPRPKATDKNLRTCGGHVHVGYEFKDDHQKINFVKHLDLFFIPSLIMDVDGRKRMELYGSFGSFRFKSYGLEYRSLSNFWVFSSKYRKWVWESVDKAMDAWQNNVIDIDSERKPIGLAYKKNDVNAINYLMDKYQLHAV